MLTRPWAAAAWAAWTSKVLFHPVDERRSPGLGRGFFMILGVFIAGVASMPQGGSLCWAPLNLDCD